MKNELKEKIKEVRRKFPFNQMNEPTMDELKYLNAVFTEKAPKDADMMQIIWQRVFNINTGLVTRPCKTLVYNYMKKLEDLYSVYADLFPKETEQPKQSKRKVKNAPNKNI